MSAIDLSRKGIRALHDNFTSVARSFASYNYREYFLRRSDHRFNTELPALLKRYEAVDDAARQQALRPWFEDAQRDLAQLKRAAIVNRMFEAPKLVVEGELGENLAKAGGGAGMEAG
jgi:hypothetical protein